MMKRDYLGRKGVLGESRSEKMHKKMQERKGEVLENFLLSLGQVPSRSVRSMRRAAGLLWLLGSFHSCRARGIILPLAVQVCRMVSLVLVLNVARYIGHYKKSCPLLRTPNFVNTR